MATRYYNLENEAKAYLKTCNDRGIVNQTSTKILNDYIIARKNNNQDASFLATNPIALNGLVLWLDASIGDSYPAGGNLWKDLSNNNNNYTLNNNPLFTKENGGGIIFNGSNTFALGNNNFTVPPNMSIACFIRRGAAPSSNFPAAFFSGSATHFTGGNTTNNGILLTFPNTTSNTDFIVRYGDNTLNGTSLRGLTLTSDMCYMGFSLGTSLNLFLNNSITSFTRTTFGGAALGNSSYTGPSYIGNWNTFGRFMRSTMYSIMIYNRALTNAEILQNYNAQRSRFGL